MRQLNIKHLAIAKTVPVPAQLNSTLYSAIAANVNYKIFIHTNLDKLMKNTFLCLQNTFPRQPNKIYSEKITNTCIRRANRLFK